MSKQPDEISRRSWDVEAYANRARERQRAEKHAEEERLRARKASESRNHVDGDPFAPTRAWLRKRDYAIDLDSKVGSTEVVNSIEGGGFRCNVCDVTMKDSNRYLNHVNSRMHQKKLGMSMRVKRSTAAEIREAFAEAVRAKEALKRKQSLTAPNRKSGVPMGNSSLQIAGDSGKEG